jgi:hypothetical protein
MGRRRNMTAGKPSLLEALDGFNVVFLLQMCFSRRLSWESQNAKHQRCDYARGKRQTVGTRRSSTNVRSAEAACHRTSPAHRAAITVAGRS